ncbi:Chromate resistance exported protein [Rhizobium sp. PDO1-076]|uniref:chromate resistance protein ChrB domain-containing protein n=1 Tax=Rhizobium sp. PDO1-076 TaxID=1125979 RepID=UPI00024E2C90|nr:sulfurtransferase/chromate resistance protein [Rhizobium sp. PDO1-076]EHS53561.1 Chromate resistance exported protein [Rhizobium sp. PDO1-076]
MAPYGAISADKLFRLLGSSQSPLIVDVRIADDVAAHPFLIPGAFRRDHRQIGEWAAQVASTPTSVVVVCHQGRKLSEGVAAHLRLLGISAEVLEGGNSAWAAAGLPQVPIDRLGDGQGAGSSLWVTRNRPKIDRIACPWLIRRFIDPFARFLFVASSEVEGVADRFNAVPFDMEGVFWSHRGDLCTFDTMLSEFQLETPALLTLAEIVRGADTNRLDLAPQVAGLLAVSLGLSRLYSSDLQQLEQGLLLYDAYYRWARDAMDEKHDWVTRGGRDGVK